MAARKSTEAKRQEMILSWLGEIEGGVTIGETAAEFDISEVTANNDLVALNHADKVNVKDGMWILAEGVVTEPQPVKEEPKPAATAPKRTRRTKVQIAADQEEERKRTEYAARAAETQDDVMSQSPQVQERDKDLTQAHGKHAKPVQKAQEPVKAADGTNVTVPVSEGSEERRELDAAKGERLISEDFIPSFEESKITEDFTPPSMIPAVPTGVNENTWVMAFYANTASARAWWMAKAQSQMTPAA